MNKTLITVLFFTSLMPAAQASTEKQYDENALQLLSAVFNYCPIEFIQAMKGANRVGRAEYSSPRPVPGGPSKETYKITTVGGGYAPSFESYDVATLTIQRESIPSEFVPDKPGEWKTTCSISAKSKK